MPNSALPDVSIIIVSWNVRDYLAVCLDSIFTESLVPLNVEVIVVDSASNDDTVQMLRTKYPDVICLAQTENIGFTRGNNIGLAAARGRHLLLLNPDTEVIGDALHQMVAYLDAYPEVGIVGPHTLNSDGTHQSTRRRFPTLVTAIFESTWLQRFAPHQVLDHYYVRDAADTDTVLVDWVQGSALMARRDVYAQIGPLDDSYVMYSEEMDWCKRARNAGWKVAYLGSAQITHHGGKSSEQVVASKHIYFQESKLRYFYKHHGLLAAAVLRLFLVISYGQQLLVEGLKGLLGHRRPLRQERVKVYWQVIRSLALPGYRS
jgi:N-acetylglucosaminyl-diphospho-decaprenol L-rhamnosyltransferase